MLKCHQRNEQRCQQVQICPGFSSALLFFVALVFFIAHLGRPDSQSRPSNVERTADSFLHSFSGDAFWRIVGAWGWRQPNPRQTRQRTRSRRGPARPIAPLMEISITSSTAISRPSFGRAAMRLDGACLATSSSRSSSVRERRRILGWPQPPTQLQRHPSSRPPSSADCAWRIWCSRAPVPAGTSSAWEHFVTVYRQPLTRAAIAITGSETLGRDLADQLYAELYGLNVREGAAALPAALLPRPRLADGLAAHYACAAPRGSLSTHAPRGAP